MVIDNFQKVRILYPTSHGGAGKILKPCLDSVLKCDTATSGRLVELNQPCDVELAESLNRIL